MSAAVGVARRRRFERRFSGALAYHPITMRALRAVGLVAMVMVAGACAKHKCDLSSGSDKETYGDVAPMTHGAFSCYVSDGTLVASFGDTSVADVTAKYQAFLEKDGWTNIKTEDKHGTRSNGNSYDGKILMAEKNGKKVGTLIYPLSGNLIETVSTVK